MIEKHNARFVGVAACLLAALAGHAAMAGGPPALALEPTFPNLDTRDAGTALPDNFAVIQVRRVRLPTLVPGVASAPTWIVVLRNGRMFVVRDRLAPVASTPLLRNIDPVWVTRDLSQGEEGYFALAIDPDAGTDPTRAFAYYTLGKFGGMDLFRAPIIAAPRAGGGVDWTFGTPVLVMRIDAGGHHYGGDVAFGPDGYLYLATGENDVFDRARSPANTMGKLLRIDVHSSGLTPNYGVPANNPWRLNGMGQPNAPCTNSGGQGNDYSHPCPEIYAVGFRNPFRFAFDRVGGALWLGDVGAQREEINRPTIGGDFGWDTCEGTTCAVPPIIPAVAEIPRTGCTTFGYAIIGGTVYRGSASSLQGRYIAGDSSAGKLYAVENPYGTPTVALIHNANCADTGFHPAGFTEDEFGELYVSSLDVTPGRAVWRITSQDSVFANGFE